jgi:hypothetical protein
MITIKDRVTRKPGDNVQKLVRETYLFGRRISALVLDTEIVPEHVMISIGCFGDWGDWRSKFYDQISAQQAAKLAA